MLQVARPSSRWRSRILKPDSRKARLVSFTVLDPHVLFDGVEFPARLLSPSKVELKVRIARVLAAATQPILPVLRFPSINNFLPFRSHPSAIDLGN